MARTATDEEVVQVSRMIAKVMEPKIQALIDEFNKLLAPRGLQAGAELQWYIEGVEDETAKVKSSNPSG